MTITELPVASSSGGCAVPEDGAVGALGGAPAAPRVIGLDLSLTSTGIAAPTGLHRIRTTGHKGDSITSRARRLHDIRNEVLTWCRNADLVVIEGPSFASQHGSMHDRAGLWWLIVHRLVANHIPVAILTPAQRAKYATGKGNAGKDLVLAETVRRFPTFAIDGNDVADAVVLMAAGLDHLGWPLVVMPDAHRKTLAAVEWPELVSA